MANLSITAAWNEATAFVRREAQLLFPIAFLLGSLPGAAIQFFGPQQQPAPGQMPEPGAWLLLVAVGLLLTIISAVAISYLALRPGMSVGDALGRAVRRFLSVLATFLIVGVGAGILLFILSVVAVALVPGAAQSAASGRAPGPEMVAAMGLVFLLLAPFAFYFLVKLCLTIPVAAAEDVGPFGIIGRSWQLTRGHFWKLLGFLILFAIAAAVVLLAIQFVVGSLVMLVAGRPEPGSLALLVLLLIGAVISAIFSMYFGATLARIYAQLTGDNVADVFR